MATSPDFAAYITEQLGGVARGVTCRKMFGEYGLHCYGKFFAVICDDTLYFKPTQAGKALLVEGDALACAPPYDGAKDYYRIDNPDDRELLQAMLDATVNDLPDVVPRRKAKSKV